MVIFLANEVYIEVPHPPSTNHMYTPISKGRQVMKGNVKRYKAQAGYIAKTAARNQGWILTDKPVKMTIWWTPPDRRRRDSSNIIKALEDSFSSIIYEDDSQVMSLTIHKLPPQKPGSATVVVSLDEGKKEVE